MIECFSLCVYIPLQIPLIWIDTWWYHDMGTLSALLVPCEVHTTARVDSPRREPVMQSFYDSVGVTWIPGTSWQMYKTNQILQMQNTMSNLNMKAQFWSLSILSTVCAPMRNIETRPDAPLIPNVLSTQANDLAWSCKIAAWHIYTSYIL